MERANSASDQVATAKPQAVLTLVLEATDGRPSYLLLLRFNTSMNSLIRCFTLRNLHEWGLPQRRLAQDDLDNVTKHIQLDGDAQAVLCSMGGEAVSIDVHPLNDGCLLYGDEVLEQTVSVAKSCGAITLKTLRTTIERVFPHLLNDESMVQLIVSRMYFFTSTLIAGRVMVASSRPSRPLISRHLCSNASGPVRDHQNAGCSGWLLKAFQMRPRQTKIR